MWSVALALLLATVPVTERGAQVDDYHGVKVADPYRWLEDLDSPQTQAWVASQRAYTGAWFAAAPQLPPMLARMKRLWNHDRMPLYGSNAGIVVRGGRIFFLQQTGLANQPVLYVREGTDAPPRVLLDLNTVAADGTASLSTWAPSPDGKWLAYGIARAGSDWQAWRVREVSTGKDLDDQLDWIKFSAPSWSADSRGFYYSRYPQPQGNALTSPNEFQKLYYHRLETAQSADPLIYERPDHKDWQFTPHATEDGRYLAILVEQGTLTQTLLFYQDLKAADGKTHELIPEFYAAQSFLGSRGDVFYVQTTYRAPRGRVVAVDLKTPARDAWTEVVPQSNYRLEQSTLDGSWLVLQYLKDATGIARVRSLDGRPGYDVPLPANATIAIAENSRRYFSVVSFTSPQTIYDCGAEGNACRPLLDATLPFDPSLYTSRQVFYPSKDGTRIPMFLVHRRGLLPDGSHPALLYGYGGFDISIKPDFTPRFLGFLEMGGVLAVANLRGGGEYGEEWHSAGTRQHKQNVFDDFIAAAEWLISNRYTTPSKLSIEGRSNGGLLIGAVLNQRPDLFAAAVPWVGVMDMLRFHKFTIGAAWVSDYGSPDDPEDFRAIYKYSPLHNIREAAKYPATLIVTADHDDRVVPSHSFKYAAALQRAQRGDAPVLIRIGASAGHGSGKPTSMRIEEDADVLAFLANRLGLDPGTGDEPKEAPLPPVGEWQSMFDGVSLKGWKETPFTGHGKVSVEKGVIILGSGYMTGITWNGAFPYMDYEIRFEAARLEGSDFFASITFPVEDSHATWIVGGWGGSLVGISSLDGMDASENETGTAWQIERGRFYTHTLRVSGGRISAWIDKDPAIDVFIHDRAVHLRFGEIELNRPLGFASYSTVGAIRKIEYRRLPPPAAEATAEPEP